MGNISFHEQDILIGGTSGNSTTVEWLMAEIIRKPDLIQRAQAELDAAVGRRRSAEESDIPRLPFLRCLIKETLRLHPVTPLLIPRVSSRTCVVAGHLIPAGARVVTNAWAIHTDPKLWDQPHVFRPDRFMATSASAGGWGWGGEFNFLPFGAGRRRCPGIPLVDRMLPLVVANFLHLFEWRLPEGELPDLNGRYGVTLTKEKPLLAVAIPRFSDANLVSREVESV